jgi:hypothetical protein
MTPTPNPFLRGYTQFNISRVLLVTSDDDTRLHYRPVHFLQADLSDSQLEGTYCHFGNDFALIPERQTLPEDLIRQCPHTGFVVSVLHSITADQAGVPVHVGDAHSAEAAQEVVRQLIFDTGHYSRCWEVSAKHLTPMSRRWLERCADGLTPRGVLFQAFHISGSAGAAGVRLQATPWTDTHLSDVVGFDTAYLRQSQELAQMPPNLIYVLQQAALADTRILVFDPIAPVLEGLLLHD